MTAVPRATAAVIGLLGGLAAVTVTPAGADELRIQVITVRASDVGRCDERLDALRTRLRRVSGYRGFEMIDDVSRTVTLRSETAIRLPGGRALRLLPKRMAENIVQMQVRLLDGRRRLLDTNLRIPNGSTMVLGVGPEGGEGEEATLFVLKTTDVR